VETPYLTKINTGRNKIVEIKYKLLRVLRHLRIAIGTLRYA